MSASPSPPLPWLDAVLGQALAMRRAHAVLLHGAAGDGLFDAAEAITRAWLCDAVARGAPRACGSCGGCHLVTLNQHPDLHVLVPEDLRPTLGVQPGAANAGGEVEAADGDGRSKRKPSRQIRVGEVRSAIDWIVTSSSRGGAKVVLIHPAEAMNVQAANALLKTLEEPPRGARLLLTAAQPSQLLPTVLSRCQVLPLRSPPPEVARNWLHQQGLDQPEVLLAACSNRPLDALAMAAAGIDATRWREVPGAVLARQAQVFSGWRLAQLFDALQKLCHDGLALAAGGAPRFYPAQALSAPASIEAMAAWSKALSQRARRIDHPWNEGLLIDALLLEAQAAWSGSPRPSDTLDA